jgi:hypothetical protein
VGEESTLVLHRSLSPRLQMGLTRPIKHMGWEAIKGQASEEEERERRQHELDAR